jgi:hypothetical protein
MMVTRNADGKTINMPAVLIQQCNEGARVAGLGRNYERPLVL